MRLLVNQDRDPVSYYGHGKLLLTGEYAVLDGALSLAVPTQLGQRLCVKELSSSGGLMYWVALNSKREIWLHLSIDTTDFTCLNENSDQAKKLTAFLKAARELNPAFLSDGKDYAVETCLEFPNEWGFGSSSTLVHTLATWAQVDGFALLQKTIGGSGYDVACAAASSALLYRLSDGVPEVLPLSWKPPFADSLYLVYLGQKQLSAEGIRYYREKVVQRKPIAEALTRITEAVVTCTALAELEQLMEEHETVLSRALAMPKVKSRLFADYWGAVKSLGAWGGDFVLMTHSGKREDLQNYLQQKGKNVFFRYDEIILQ